jgi:hypothetical protein
LKSSQEDIGLLEAYLKRRLDNEAKSALELRLATDQDLRADLEDLKVLQQGMRAKVLADKLEMMRGWESEVGSLGKENEKKRSIRLRILLLILIALFLVVIWFVLNNNSNSPNQEKDNLFANRIDTDFILHKTERSTSISDSLSVNQRIAYDLFAIEEFGEAIPLLDSLWSNHHDTLAFFYLGLSYRYEGENEKSREILRSTILQNNPRFKSSLEKINK